MANTKKTFESFRDDFKRLVVSMIALGAIPPIMDFVFSVGAPWPDRTKVAFFTTVALWIVLLWTYAVWLGVSSDRLKTRISICATLTIVSLLLYIASTSRLVWDTTSPRDQVVIGLTPNAKTSKIMNLDPGFDMRRWLAENEWNVNAVWEPDSVALCRFAVLTSWLVSFGFLAAMTSTFLLHTKYAADGIER